MGNEIIHIIEPGLGGLDSDTDLSKMDPNDSPTSLGDQGRLNIEYLDGKKGIVANGFGNELETKALPSGTNQIHGTCPDRENNAVIYFIQNSNDDDCIIRYNHDGTFDDIAYEEDLGFVSTSKITKAELVGEGNDTMLIWTDDNDEIGCVNVYNLENDVYTALDDGKTKLIKAVPSKPNVAISDDATRETNNLKGNLFQFMCQFVYENKMRSAWGFNSDIIYNYYDEEFGLNYKKDITKSNRILLSINIDYDNVEYIRIAVRKADVGGGAASKWLLADVIEADYPTATYYFYNDKNYPVIPSDVINSLGLQIILPYYDVPRTAGMFELLHDNRLVFGKVKKRYDLLDTSNLDISLEVARRALSISGISDYIKITYGSQEDLVLAYSEDIESMHRIFIMHYTSDDDTQVMMDSIEYEEYLLSSDLYMADVEAIESYFIKEITRKTKFTDLAVSSGGAGEIRFINNYEVDGETYSVTYWKSIPTSLTDWTERDSDRNWKGIAISATGEKQTAVVNSGYVYRSFDYGLTWNTTGGHWHYKGVAISATGEYQTVIASYKNIYVSDDYGETWETKGLAADWRAIAMSSTGQYQIAAIYGGRLYNSDNYGQTWTDRDASLNWVGVAISADGEYQTAVVYGGNIKASYDFGVTWNIVDANDRDYISVSMSSTGQYQTAIAYNEQIYVSIDYGITWLAKSTAKSWAYGGVAVSATGEYQTAVGQSNQIYISRNYGSTWEAVESSRNWQSIAMSDTGQYQTAGNYGGKLYTATQLSDLSDNKYLTFKSGSHIYLGIQYYDKFKRPMGIHISDDTKIYIPFQTELEGLLGAGTYYDVYANAVKYTLGHQAPTDAVYWSWVYGGNNIEQFFQIPIVVGTDVDYNFSSKDYSIEDNYIHLNLSQAINRVLEKNSYGEYFYRFDVNKGDRVRVIGYFDYNSGVHDQCILFDENIDLEVIGLDPQGRVIIQNWELFTDSSFLNGEETQKVIFVEFYRRKKEANLENIFYREVGDLLQVVDRNHYASTISGYSTDAQNQSYPGTDAVGVINFGDTYKMILHYFYKEYYDSGDVKISSYHKFSEFLHSSMFYNSRAISEGRGFIYDENQKEETLNAAVWGGKYSDENLNFNELNKFNPENIRFLDDKHGSIYGMQERGFVLNVIQQSKVTHFDIYRYAQTLTDGNSQYVATNDVLGSKRPSPTQYGTIFPFSVVPIGQHIYFFDIYTADFCRIEGNGIRSITDKEYRMRKYTRDKCNALLASGISNLSVYAGHDPINDLYVVTFLDSNDADDQSNNETLAFHIPSERWKTHYSFTPSMYAKIGETIFLSFTDVGVLYKHNSSTADRNNFYGVAYDSKIKILANKNPEIDKRFDAIHEISNDIWEAPDTDSIIVNPDAIEHQDVINYTKHFYKMQSELKEGQFKFEEGEFKAEFLRDNTTTTGSALPNDLINGRALRGKELTIKLENDNTSAVHLKMVKIISSISK